MAKQSISGRVAQLARADIPALLARSDDSESLVDQLVADLTMTIAEAESAVAQTAATRRLLEQDRVEDLEAAAAWRQRAEATETDAAARREGGDSEAADRLSGLAQLARDEHDWHAAQAEAAGPALDAFDALASRLEQGVAELRSRLELLTTQREALVERAAAAGTSDPQARRTLDVLGPAEALAQFDRLVGEEAS